MPFGQTAFDAARTVKVFHLCKESQAVPEQSQRVRQRTTQDIGVETEEIIGMAERQKKMDFSERETGVCL